MNGKRTIVGLVLCAVAPVRAQVIDADRNAGAPDARAPAQPSPEALGDPVAGPFNLATEGESGQLGVVNAWGSYWVTSRSLNQPNHRVLKFARDGTFVRGFDQDPGTGASAWGYRDGAADEGANQIYFGYEGGRFVVYDYDPLTGNIAFSCTVIVDQGSIGTIRALARTPGGTFITKSFGGPIYEFDGTGRLLNTWPDPGISAYGCAYDAASDSYWWSGSGNLVVETDAAMTLTGRTFDGSVLFPNFIAQGGLDLHADARSPTGSAFVILSQGMPAQIGSYEADTGASANNANTTGPIDCQGACPCACDLDPDPACDIFDFLAFQTAFVAGDPCACEFDPAPACDIFDFLAFQTQFVAGCP